GRSRSSSPLGPARSGAGFRKPRASRRGLEARRGGESPSSPSLVQGGRVARVGRLRSVFRGAGQTYQRVISLAGRSKSSLGDPPQPAQNEVHQLFGDLLRRALGIVQP